MARIFLSHSSKDNAEARALGDWLADNGWPAKDVFLDIDPESGIAPGERWQRALNDAAGRCEAVIFLVSRNWLTSRWCLEELSLAHKLNRRLFAALIGDVKLSDVPSRLQDEWQLVDLDGGRDGIRFDVELPGGKQGHATFSREGLSKLRVGLVKAGLDPAYFEWPPKDDKKRAPYRGLAPMEAEDAGIFYGREAATIAALAGLRGLAETPPPRLMVVLGASGAGKSSFMRAGLIPRLKRDDHHFLVLPVVRPQRRVLSGDTGLAASLEKAGAEAKLKWTRAQTAKAIAAGPDAVQALLAELTAATMKAMAASKDATPPTIILPLDQAEELFQAEGREEAFAALDLMAGLMQRGAVTLLATIRTDSYEQMQNAPALTGIRQTPFNLPALARGAYQRVIEGPAERLKDSDRKLTIDPALTEALMKDIEEGGAKDSLPLLAFTLERLYLEHGADGDLTLREYEESGRISGAIEAAVEQALAAADNDPKVPRDKDAKLALLRRAMIPWLAGIDPDTKSPRRQVAKFSDLPDEAKPLVHHFIEQRLLSTDRDEKGERTVEPAHEALLRQWGLIDDWLKEDISILATLEGVRRAARDWDANARRQAWLAHGGSRLEDAETIHQRPDLAQRLEPTDLDYLASCRTAESERIARERRSARLIRLAAIAATLLAVVAGVFASWATAERSKAVKAQLEAADAALRLARELAQRGIKLADSLVADGQVDAAALMLLDANKALQGAEPTPGQTQDLHISLDRVGRIYRMREVVAVGSDKVAVSGPDGLYLVDRNDFGIELFNSEGLKSFSPSDPAIKGTIFKAYATEGGLVTLFLSDGRLLRAEAEKAFRPLVQLGELPVENPDEFFGIVSRDGTVVYDSTFVDTDGTVFTLPSGIWGRHYLRTTDGRRFFWGAYDEGGAIKLQEIRRNGASVEFVETTFASDEFDRIQYFSCLYEGGAIVAPADVKIVFDDAGVVNRVCRSYPSEMSGFVIFSNTTSGSGGVFFNHAISFQYGDPKRIEDHIQDLRPGILDQNTIRWLSVDSNKGRVGLVSSRNVIVLDEKSLLLDVKHQGRTGPGYFLDDGRIAVFDEVQSTIVIYGPEFSDDVTEPPEAAELHKEFCHSSLELPGLVIASIEDSSLTLAAGEKTTTLEFADLDCIKVSFDASKLLVRSDGGRVITLDYAKALLDGNLNKGNHSELPGSFTSAYFVDDGGIVTADGGYVVKRWSLGAGGWASTDIYGGERPVFDAEPNADGSILLINEDLGGSYLRVFLYGVESQRPWRDLGSAYKGISANFTAEGDIVLHQSGETVIRISPIPSLLEMVEARLPDHCRPKVAGDYRSSPCWAD